MKQKYEFGNVFSVVRHLVRCEPLHALWSKEISRACFNIPEGGYYIGEDFGELPQLLVYIGLEDYYAGCVDRSVAIGRKDLEEYISNAILREGIYVDPNLRYRMFDEEDPTYGFLAYIFDPAVHCTIDSGRTLIQGFVWERVVERKLEDPKAVKTFAKTEKDRAEAIKHFEDIAAAANRINSIGYNSAIDVLLPDQSYFDNLPDGNYTKATGISYIDESLKGGMRPGDCYGLIGCTGAGKTSMFIELAWNAAKVSFVDAGGEKPELVLYYTIEESATAQKERLISCGSCIDRDFVAYRRGSIEGILSPSTGPENMKPYELQRWPDERVRRSEWERYQEFKMIASKTIAIRNFSGVKDAGDDQATALLKSRIGRGGVREILDDARRYQDAYQVGIRAIFIDYVGVMCDRMADGDDRKYYSLLARVGDDCRTYLAGQLDCAVWVAHQANGLANGGTPIRWPKLTDAEGCKKLVHDMPVAFSLGVPDKSELPNGERGTRVLFKEVKNRYASDTEAGRGLILKHDPNFARLNNVTDHYFRDLQTQTLMPKRHAT